MREWCLLVHPRRSFVRQHGPRFLISHNRKRDHQSTYFRIWRVLDDLANHLRFTLSVVSFSDGINHLDRIISNMLISMGAPGNER